MVRCCAGQEEAAEPRVPRMMLFPMWVISVQSFLEMAAGPPKCHQQLMAEGKLVQWAAGMFCIFVSHQWLGNSLCDPKGEQMETLRQVLRGFIDGSRTLQSDLPRYLTLKKTDELSDEDRVKIRDGYLWMDWLSIFQLSMCAGGEGDTHELQDQVQRAIWSIPAYISSCDIFLVLCPPAQHVDTGAACGRASWESRGWCRLEMCAASLGDTRKRIVMVTSRSSAFFIYGMFLLSPPGEGAFTDPADRIKLLPVMEEIVDRHIEAEWQDGPRRIPGARLVTAMRTRLLGGLGTKQDRDVRDMAMSELPQFLRRLRFDSPTSLGDGCFGPVHCAAAAGNVHILQQLAAASADMNQKTRGIFHDLPILPKGATPVHVASIVNGDPEVIRSLLQLRADLNITDNLGFSALHFASGAGHLELTKYYLDVGLDVHKTNKAGGTALHATAILGRCETAVMLLEHGAVINARNALGLTPLLYAVLAGRTECCRFLVDRGADVHVEVKPQGMKGTLAAGLLGLARPFLPKTGPIGTLTRLRGQTALFAAADLEYWDIEDVLREAEVFSI